MGTFIHISEEQCVRLSDRYPVILSIENHCSVPQQKKMAQYLTEIFGDKLNLSSIKADVLGRLPSPEALKGRILVKVPSLFRVRETLSYSSWLMRFSLCSASRPLWTQGTTAAGSVIGTQLFFLLGCFCWNLMFLSAFADKIDVAPAAFVIWSFKSSQILNNT